MRMCKEIIFDIEWAFYGTNLYLDRRMLIYQALHIEHGMSQYSKRRRELMTKSSNVRTTLFNSLLGYVDHYVAVD
jgi:hypothetical protein